MIKTIAYTDGSAKPQNGYIGFGIHSYTVDTDKVVKNGKTVQGQLQSDQGYIEKSKASLYSAKPISTITTTDIVGYSGLDGTNNVAELLAIIHILRYVASDDIAIDELSIYSDSMYSIGVFNKLLGNMDDISSVIDETTINRDYYILMYNELVKLKEKVECNISHVKAHDINVGNVMADKLAYIGRLYSVKQDRSSNGFKIDGLVNIDSWKGNNYWDYKTDRPLYAWMKTIYRLSDVSDKKLLPYMVYKDSLEIGKPDTNTSYGLISLDEDPIDIGMVLDNFDKMQDGVIKPYMVNVNVLYNSTIKRMIDTYGDIILVNDSNKKRNVLSVVPQREDFIDPMICSEIFPIGVSRIAQDNVDILKYAMNDIESHEENSDQVVLSDITELIYDITTTSKGLPLYKIKDRDTLVKNKGFKLKVDIAGGKHSIPIHLGTDIPPIVELGRFGKHQPIIQSYHRIYNKKMIETFIYINIPGIMRMISVNLYSRYKFI